MKKLFLIPLCLLFIVACKNGPSPDRPDIDAYNNYPYSSLTVEQQKDKLADESDAILKNLKDLPNADGVKVLKSFFNLLEQSTPEMEEVLDYDKNKNIINVKDMNGEFTWNAATESWSKKALSNKVVFNFPVNNSTSNNGKVEITGTGSGKQENVDGGKIELPKDAKFTAFLSNKEVASIEVKATDPNIDNIAKDASVKVALGNYVISTSAKKDTDSKVSSTFSFKSGSNVILDAILSSTIDWEYIYEYERYMGYDYETWESIYETVKDTTIMLDYQVAELNIGNNLAIVGYVNVKEMNKKLDEIYEKYDNLPWNEVNREAETKEKVAVYNANMKMTLVSKKDKCKIATLKFICVTEIDDYDGYKYFYMEPVFVFNDKTEVSAETFFSTGFNKVIGAWMDFLESFN